MSQKIFIGTDTGVGKTVLTALLARFLRARGVHAAALKPVCSGGRDDARKIFAALDGALSLDEINPWHFRAPLAPLLAARREKKSVKLAQVRAHVRVLQKRFDILLIEGAGGLLSPLGENFNSRDLILALRAAPIIVAQNQLGAVNRILLTLEALPKKFRDDTHVVLVSPQKLDLAARTNAGLLAHFFPAEKIFTVPWLGKNFEPEKVLKKAGLKRTLAALARI